MPLCRTPASARSRHAAVESYSSSVVSTVEINPPGTLRLSRPRVMPSALTKNAGHRLSRAEEFEQLIHTWFDAAADGRHTPG